ncbi:hypothetical protein H072_11015 [Dactylellina haptotyla CBS 200.50]|uniref:Uncharacterized protein n=1 Tax=Dactylellina haptotyla (strain CBS 200.50) TaxID=1284197 RepID=S7ZXT8_DACHA|nr:hypothetical protein H072_11015 [Dactylellina haptotyla CBS 200.50]
MGHSYCWLRFTSGSWIRDGNKGKTKFTTSVEWSVPDSAEIQISGPENTKFRTKGWDKTKFNPDFKLDGLNIEGSVAAFVKVRGILGLTVLQTPIGLRVEYRAGLKASATVGLLPEDTCKKDPKWKKSEASKTGLGVGLSGLMDVAVGFGINKTPIDIKATPWSWEPAIAQRCWAKEIDQGVRPNGMKPAPNGVKYNGVKPSGVKST